MFAIILKVQKGQIRGTYRLKEMFDTREAAEAYGRKETLYANFASDSIGTCALYSYEVVEVEEQVNLFAEG